MPKWTITVTADRTVCQDFEIEADTLEQAKEDALEEARNENYGWEGQDYYDNHQVTHSEEEDGPEDEEGSAKSQAETIAKHRP